MGRVLAGILVFFASSMAANGASIDYYVDADAGDDTADGASPATAWRSLAQVQALAASLPSAAAIHLKRGCVWSGAAAYLNIDQADITVDDYGAGALPRIDGRVAMPPSGFALVTGTAHTYAFPLVGQATGAEQHNVWEDGVRLVRAASAAAVETTVGSYYAPPESAWTQGVATTIDVHPSSDDDPSSNGRGYSTQGVTWAIRLGSEANAGAQLTNIEAMGGCHHNGNIQLGRNAHASGVVTRWGTIHSLYIDSGTLVDCESLDCEQGFDFVANKGSSSDGTIEMDGCVADVDATTGVIHGPGYFVHGTTQTSISFVDCVSRSHHIGFGVNGIGQDGQQVQFSGCQVFCGADPEAPSHAFDVNTLDYGGGFTSTVAVSDCLSDCYGVFFYGYMLQANTVVSGTDNRGVIRGNNLAVWLRNTTDCEWSHNSFYASSGGAYALYETNDGTTCSWHNNVADRFTTGTNQFNATVYSASDNLWHRTGGGTPDMRVAGTYYSTFGAYSTARDPTSVNSDPLWVEAPDLHDDFTLQAASPAVALSAGYPAYAGTTGSTSGAAATGTAGGSTTTSTTTAGSSVPTASRDGQGCGLGSMIGALAVLLLGCAGSFRATRRG